MNSMRIRRFLLWSSKLVLVLSLAVLPASCGGGDKLEWGWDNSTPAPTITIDTPTSAQSFSTTANGVTIGGDISHASFVEVTNDATGITVEGHVSYNAEGYGTWFAEIYGLVPGENELTATTDANGGRTAHAHLTIIRPLQLADEIFNGPDRASSSTYWTDLDSMGQTHMIALFADGTGRSTTGNLLEENAGAVTDFHWTMLSPDHIQITDCPTCSFQEIYNITGSLDEGSFLGVTITVGEDTDGAAHPFGLTQGSL